MPTVRESMIRVWATFRGRHTEADLEAERAHLELPIRIIGIARASEGRDTPTLGQPARLRLSAGRNR